MLQGGIEMIQIRPVSDLRNKFLENEKAVKDYFSREKGVWAQ